jgi:ribonuclease J
MNNFKNTRSFSHSKNPRRTYGNRNNRPIRKNTPYPNIKGDTVRIIALGGFEEVGNNMYALEHKDSIYIFDMGFQFVSETETPGVDFLLPNIKYLEDRKDKIKAVIITHGHLDHIGGIPFLMGKLGNPPLYTRELTSHLILKRMSEFKTAPKLQIKLVEPGDQIKIDDLSFEFFHVSHSIPNSMGIIAKTPFGNIIFSGDLKLTHENGKPVKFEEDT